jgi:hypothetical protein
MPGKAYIATSGWNYKSWRNGFYGDTPQKQWLRFCAEPSRDPSAGKMPTDRVMLEA